DQVVVFTLLLSGALSGAAGIIEVAGPVGHLQPGISPGYGFTAIIVAFLGRLNPLGILVAGLFVALTFIGGEQAQISMKIPLDLTKVFQGILLFYVLACDSSILYRIRLIRTPKALRAPACGQPGRGWPRANYSRRRFVGLGRLGLRRGADHAGSDARASDPHRTAVRRPHPVRPGRLRLPFGRAGDRNLVVPLPNPGGP